MVLVLYLALVCYLPIVSVFIPSANLGPGLPDIGITRLFIYLLFLAFIVRVSILHRIKLNKWIMILSIFYTIVFTSVLWSNYSLGTTTIQQIFNTVFTPLFIALVALNLFTNTRNKNFYFKHIIIASIILSLMSIFQTIGAILTHQEIFRARGPFGSANSLAIFLVLTIPCIMYAIENRLVPSILGWIVSFSVFFGIIFTVSRKGIIMMVFCFCLFSLLKKKYKQIAIILIVLTLFGGIMFGYAFFSQRFEEHTIQKQFIAKWNMTAAGWKMFWTSPVIGLGYRGYYDNYGKYIYHPDKEKYDAHNIFITALANYGLLGFVPFIAIFLYPLIISIKIIRRKDNSAAIEYSRDMAIVCVSSIIPFMIMGWFAGGLFYSPVGVSLLYSNMTLFLSRNN